MAKTVAAGILNNMFFKDCCFRWSSAPENGLLEASLQVPRCAASVLSSPNTNNSKKTAIDPKTHFIYHG